MQKKIPTSSVKEIPLIPEKRKELLILLAKMYTSQILNKSNNICPKQ